MKNLILYFLLLVLKILINFNLDADQKQNRFSKILLKENFEFILNRGIAIIFKLNVILLLAEIDLVAKKQNCKKNAFKAYGTSCVEIIFGLLTKIVTFYR